MRGGMPWRFDRPVGIDHDDQAVGLQPVAQVPQELIGRLHLVIHVDQEDAVERLRRKHRIVGLAQLDRDIVEILALDALRQPVARLRNDIFGQHPAARTDDGASRTV